jgi:protein-S-isoprenylcysteine O-methyltransferase Ste14
MKRLSGIAFGVATHLLFAATVFFLYRFLEATDRGHPTGSLLIDAGLALQFALLHSTLLYPTVRKKLTRFIPAPFYGCFFCTVTCLQLLGTFAFWQSSPTVVWALTGVPAAGMRAGFFISWVLLFYSLYLSGLGWQTGLTPWWAWVRHRPAPRREFDPCGAYRLLRHPVYLSFGGLLWFTPHMTLDHALLTGIWTTYIFVGSWLKDRRLEHFIGADYRNYMTRVPGYPFILAGPLARARSRQDDVSRSAA